MLETISSRGAESFQVVFEEPRWCCAYVSISYDGNCFRRLVSNKYYRVGWSSWNVRFNVCWMKGMSLRSQSKCSRKLWWRNFWLLGSALTEESRNFSVNDTKNTVFNQPDPSAGWFMLQWRIIWRKLVPGCCGAHPKIVTKDLINLTSNGFIHYRRTRNRHVSRKDHGF